MLRCGRSVAFALVMRHTAGKVYYTTCDPLCEEMAPIMCTTVIRGRDTLGKATVGVVRVTFKYIFVFTASLLPNRLRCNVLNDH